MRNLSATNRCKLFEQIATDRWNHILRNHRTGNEAREIGITSDIISEIEDNRLSYPNIGVFSKESYDEKKNGADMDIFVESTPGTFVWWALQAKVLKRNGKYEGISTLRSGGEYQWEKLNRLASSGGCVVRYLFYNGKSGFSTNGRDSCNRIFGADQFGCSLVKTKDVEKVALNCKSTSFENFHPELAQPFRIITCCTVKKLREQYPIILYSGSQVIEAVRDYSIISGNVDIVKNIPTSQIRNDFSENAINEFSSQEGRDPSVRMVIRTTLSIKNS